MKKYFVIIVVLALIGAAASYYLIPRSGELALMNMRDKQFDKARAAYETELKNGKLTPEITGRIVDLYLKNSQVNEAIKVLETFTQQNPNNVNALSQLATLYQYAQRPDDYTKTLERLNQLAPDQKNLKALSDLYNAGSEYDKQLGVMEKIVGQEKDKPKSASYYRDIANLQAAQKKPEQAVKTLRELKTKIPGEYAFAQAEIMVSLLLDLNKPDEALAEAQFWAGRKPPLEEIARLVNVLHYKGAPQQALSLATPYKEQAKTNGDMLTELTAVYVTMGKQDEAYALLDGLYAAKALPPAAFGTYMDLMIARGEIDKVQAFVSGIDPASVKESQAIYLVELATERRSDGLMRTINTLFGKQDYLDAHPVFAAVLALANRSKDADSLVAKAEATPELSNEQMGQLSLACSRAFKKACALRLADNLANRKGLTGADIANIGNVYLTIGEYEKGLAFVEERRAVPTTPVFENVWVKLAAANGKTEEVLAWIKTHEATVDGRLLRDVFFLASDNKNTALASRTAELLYQREPSDETKSYMGTAYLMNKQYAEAVPLLRESRGKSDAAESTYIDALVKAGKTDAAFKTELAGYLTERLKNPKLSMKRKQQLLYVLIDAGRGDLALPYIKQNAYASGGSWASLYENILVKQGRKAELHEFWLTQAGKTTSATVKRQAAFNLLNAGYKEDAVKIFAGLADKAAPASADVKQLLYLWGPRPGTEAITWLEKRATASRGNEQAQWLAYLADYNASEQIVRITRANPELLAQDKTLKIYLYALGQTLAHTDNREALRTELRTRIASEENIATLQYYADLAGSYYLTDTARAAYDRMVKLHPEHLEANRKHGVLAFTQADYSASRTSLGYYLAHRSGKNSDEDYLADFYYGELLNRDRKRVEAQRYYFKAIDGVQALSVKPVEAKSVYAQSLFRVGDSEKAFDLYEGLIAKHPDNRTLRADYASTLIEARHYDKARAVLAADRPSSEPRVAQGESRALRLEGNLVKNYTVSANGQEVVLNVHRPAEAIPALRAVLGKTPPPWLSYASAGYDQVLLVSAENTSLSATRSGASVDIIARPAPVAASNELAAQTHLRMQLLASRVDLETGNEKAALKRLNALSPAYLRDAQLMAYTANVENYVGRWRRASTLLADAQKLTPDNEDIAQLKRVIDRQHGQHVKADYEWKQTGKTTENIPTLSGFAYVQPFTRVGFKAQNNRIHAKNITNSGGMVGDFKDDKQRGELYVQNDREDGSHLKGSLYANNDTIGAGGEYGFYHAFGRSVIELDYHKPFWEFPQAVLADASRDRFGIRHEKRLTKTVFLTGNAGYNLYNVDVEDNVQQTINLNFSLIKNLYAVEGKYFSLSYGFDGEYTLSNDKRTTTGGVTYDPFDMPNREVHSLNALGRYEWGENTLLGGSAGWAFDRYGGNGPLFEAYANHWLNDWVEVGARASTGLGVSDSDDDITRLGGHVKVRF